MQVSDGMHIVRTETQSRYSLAVAPERTVLVIEPDPAPSPMPAMGCRPDGA
jgi:hypothetical protein